MLVEDHQQGKVVPCLLCKTAIKVGGSTPHNVAHAAPHRKSELRIRA